MSSDTATLKTPIIHFYQYYGDNGFVISDPKNSYIPNFIKIRSLKKCML